MLVVREDIGRHNAVDKVIGWARGERPRPADRNRPTGQRARVVRADPKGRDGRHSRARRGLGAVLARRRPGPQAGLTLVAFLRGESMNVYTRPGPRQALTVATWLYQPISTAPTHPRSANASTHRCENTLPRSHHDGGNPHCSHAPPSDTSARCSTSPAGLVDRGDRRHLPDLGRRARRTDSATSAPRPRALPAAADVRRRPARRDLPGRAETSGIRRVNFDIEHVFLSPMPPSDRRADRTDGSNPIRRDPRRRRLLRDRAVPARTIRPARPPVLTYSTHPCSCSAAATPPRSALGSAPRHRQDWDGSAIAH